MTKRILYFSSCSARMLNPDQAAFEALLHEIFHSLGIEMIRLTGINNFCCGLAFKNKGFPEVALEKATELEALLWAGSEEGALPILCETSSCVLMMRQNFQKPLQIYDVIEYLAPLIPQDRLAKSPKTVMLHIPCSMQHLGIANDLIRLAQACAEIIIPPDITCCGFAGDKGFFMKELNQSALSTLKAHIPEGCQAGYSASRSCEIGLSRASGIPYQSLIYLIAEAMGIA